MARRIQPSAERSASSISRPTITFAGPAAHGDSITTARGHVELSDPGVDRRTPSHRLVGRRRSHEDELAIGPLDGDIPGIDVSEAGLGEVHRTEVGLAAVSLEDHVATSTEGLDALPRYVERRFEQRPKSPDRGHREPQSAQHDPGDDERPHDPTALAPKPDLRCGGGLHPLSIDLHRPMMSRLWSTARRAQCCRSAG
jgi:hypothetical protein